MISIRWGVVFLASLPWLLAAHAAQTGPVMPTHRYPTSQSFHLSYRYAYLQSSENYVESRLTETLPNSGKITRSQQSVIGEYQPDRTLSAGLILSYDHLSLSDSSGGRANKKALGDQRIFGEFRFYDDPGVSVGVAALIKFPLYSNPTYDSLTANRANAVALLGDAQTDFTLLGTSEYWPADFLRFRGNFGYTYRTEHYSGEFPFMAAVAYVSPRYDLDLRFIGNLSQKNDSFDASSAEVDRVRALFGSSQYAYAKDPWIVTVNPSGEVWFNAHWGLGVEYKQSIMGLNSPSFWEVRGGLTYRWAATAIAKKKYKDIDIGTDQEAGVFPGEKLRSRSNDSGDASTEEEGEASPKKAIEEEEQIPEDQ